jgi:hypothetical protein
MADPDPEDPEEERFRKNSRESCKAKVAEWN